MRSYLTALIFALPMLGYSITDERTDLNSTISLDGEEPKMTGYKDAAGKQAYWIIYGKDMPEKAGYPLDGKIEEGNYKDDNKTGEWIVYHLDGKTPKLKGNYVDGRPNGPYVKMNEKGTTIEKSSFNNNKLSGDYVSYHDNGVPHIQKTFNADGKEQGPVTISYESGIPQFVYNKVNGVTVGEATRYWPDGSVKEILIYSPDGKVVSTTIVNAEPTTALVVENGSGGPNGSGGVIKDGNKKFDCDGYNKLYNKEDEIWMDGTFKDCKLWSGDLYKYDSDGILLKFEVWKNGMYHSEGQLAK